MRQGKFLSDIICLAMIMNFLGVIDRVILPLSSSKHESEYIYSLGLQEGSRSITAATRTTIHLEAWTDLGWRAYRTIPKGNAGRDSDLPRGDDELHYTSLGFHLHGRMSYNARRPAMRRRYV